MNNLGSAGNERWGDRETQRLRGLEVDCEIEFFCRVVPCAVPVLLLKVAQVLRYLPIMLPSCFSFDCFLRNLLNFV
jgi:hypothetical protein